MVDAEQKVALVTGAGRGIGRATALALARAGFALCLAARTFEELEETRRLSGLAAARSLIALIDLADADAPANLCSATLEHFGRLDLLVNNAGWAPARTPLLKLDAGDLDRILAVNLRAPLELARLAARQMADQPTGGLIANVASSAGRAMPPGEAVYAAAKAGLIAFTTALAREFSNRNVRAAVIIPGLTDTALIPHNKRLDRSAMLRAEDVASAIMSIVNSPAHLCPMEIVLEPSRDPMRTA